LRIVVDAAGEHMHPAAVGLVLDRPVHRGRERIRHVLQHQRRWSWSGGRCVGLITKTDTNPFFVKMKEGAQKAAKTAGRQLQSFAGKQDGDNESQVAGDREPDLGGRQGLHDHAERLQGDRPVARQGAPGRACS
jgi:hypothetical protein